ncbi:dienelactone hydrolase family protein [Perkinsela sp. CCAP 1560/4]|nr:dienelactone hydrolase family protein [Perkinsela sp. CCAP 1560/4]|eukprot:KNH06284.1 dienelactone hydrolase family protein [Perkinsela sp. CCAP 1560/4]
MPEHTICCPTKVPPTTASSTYSPKGEIKQFHSNHLYYIVGDTFEKAIILTYDIFGFHPCTMEFCDELSKALGYCVLMPDFFEQHPWPLDPWPLEDNSPLMKWLSEHGEFSFLEPFYAEAKMLIHSLGGKVVGGVGLCWGAKPVIQAHEKMYFEHCAIVHPAFLDVTDAGLIHAPICVITTKDDPDLADLKAALDSSGLGSASTWERFEDMHHGFCGARRLPEDENQLRRMKKAVGILTSYFQRLT